MIIVMLNLRCYPHSFGISEARRPRGTSQMRLAHPLLPARPSWTPFLPKVSHPIIGHSNLHFVGRHPDFMAGLDQGIGRCAVSDAQSWPWTLFSFPIFQFSPHISPDRRDIWISHTVLSILFSCRIVSFDLRRFFDYHSGCSPGCVIASGYLKFPFRTSLKFVFRLPNNASEFLYFRLPFSFLIPFIFVGYWTTLVDYWYNKLNSALSCTSQIIRPSAEPSPNLPFCRSSKEVYLSWNL